MDYNKIMRLYGMIVARESYREQDEMNARFKPEAKRFWTSAEGLETLRKSLRLVNCDVMKYRESEIKIAVDAVIESLCRETRDLNADEIIGELEYRLYQTRYYFQSIEHSFDFTNV